VQVALTEDSGVQLYEVLKIMTEFLNEEFQTCFASDGDYATFDTVILLERSRRLQMEALERHLEESDPSDNGEVVVGELFTASFKGASLFTRLDDQKPLPSSVVEGCQRQAFLQEDLLLTKLQQSGGAGLGLSVVDVRAFINPNGASKASSNDSGSDSLEVVIIIAIVIACVAFLFLVFAIYWAWRYDKKNRDAYLTQATAAKSPESQRTFNADDSPEAKENRAKRKSSPKQSSQAQAPPAPQSVTPSYPSVIGGDSVVDGVYPESVISEDINSSLTQYYQSGLQNYTNSNGGRLQDAGSVSSMESYGYSLDGYAPSLATPMPADTTAILSTTGTKDGAASTAASSTKKSTQALAGPIHE